MQETRAARRVRAVRRWRLANHNFHMAMWIERWHERWREVMVDAELYGCEGHTARSRNRRYCCFLTERIVAMPSCKTATIASTTTTIP